MIKKAFTLVELIVIVTILAILGTIAFISIQGYTQETRDSKRISDTRNLLEKINIELTKGVSLEQLMVIEDKKTNSLTINGKPNIPGEQGEINFMTLKEPANSFKDPRNNQDYPFAYSYGTTEVDGKVENYKFLEIAYINEKEGTTKIIGNYYKMQPLDSPSLFVGCTTDATKELENNDCPIYDVSKEVLKDCKEQTTEEGYELTTGIYDGTSIPLTKPGNTIEHGTITMERDYQCNNGKLEPTSEERTIVNCVNEENQEYVPSNNTCVVSLCQNSLPNNAEQNGQQSNTKAWHYNETQEQCAFKCILGYTYEEATNSCKRDCSGTGDGINADGYKVPDIKHNGTTPNLTRTESIVGGTGTLQRTYNCEDGTLTKNPETTISVECREKYTPDEETKTCVANTNIFNCSGKPDNTVWNMGSNDGSYTQVWNGSVWVPSESSTTYNQEPNETSCRYTNASEYHTEDNGTTFLPNTLTGTCVGQPSGDIATITSSTYPRERTTSRDYPETTPYTENGTLCGFTCNSGYSYVSGTNACGPKTLVITSATYESRVYSFTGFTLEYNSPQTKTSNPLTITGGTSTLTATFTLGVDGTTITLSGQSESISCNPGYQVSGSSCVPKTIVVTSATHNSRTYSFNFTLIYGTPQTKTSSSLAITGGTSTLTATFTLGTDGTTITLSGQSESISCNAGYYSTDNTTCKVVDSGYYSPEGSNTQTQCPGGYSCTASTTTQCSAGKYSAAGSTSCDTCSAGTYSSAGASSCTACTSGYYCPAGSTSSSGSSCPAGYSCTTNTKTQCSAGTYSVEGSTGCSTCPTGYYCPAGSGSYTSCTNKPTNSSYISHGGGSNSCSWSCNSGYTTSGNSCMANCSSQTLVNYSVSALSHGVSSTLTRSASITGGTIYYQRTFTCNNGSLSYGNESYSVSCGSGYSVSGSSCIATSASCSSQTLVSYSVTALSHGASSTFTRSASITGGTIYYQRTFTCNNGSLSYGSESVYSVSCNSGYTKSGNSCVANTTPCATNIRYAGDFLHNSAVAACTNHGSGRRLPTYAEMKNFVISGCSGITGRFWASTLNTDPSLLDSRGLSAGGGVSSDRRWSGNIGHGIYTPSSSTVGLGVYCIK